jgi:uncharacterized membrane protein
VTRLRGFAASGGASPFHGDTAPAGQALPRSNERRAYLDWLRGIAVLIMIEGHTRDSWTRLADRDRDAYHSLNIVSGFGAPIFLFLAGISLSLAAGSRLRRGASETDVGARAVRRGLMIFGLAFLFRLQSWIVSGGRFPDSLLKVDILNVMGVSMVAAALLWRVGWNPRSRAVVFAAAAIVLAMLTPLVRTSSSLAGLPDSIESYLQPLEGHATFTLLPWGAFLVAGAAVGASLDTATSAARERQVNAALLAVGLAVAFGGYAGSFLPPLYPDVSFWTTSPAFFFLRLGILLATVPLAYGLTLAIRAPRLEAFGRASLFVYWIHVEMAYGVLSTPLHRRLPLEQALVAFAAFTLFLFFLVKVKPRVVARIRAILRIDGLSPVANTSVRRNQE